MINKDFILSMKEKLEKKVAILERELQDAQKYEDIGSTSEDEVLEFEDLEERNAISKGLKDELVELKAALSRIEEGTYGICEKCSNQIEEARLSALPQCRFCASDK